MQKSDTTAAQKRFWLSKSIQYITTNIKNSQKFLHKTFNVTIAYTGLLFPYNYLKDLTTHVTVYFSQLEMKLNFKGPQEGLLV